MPETGDEVQRPSVSVEFADLVVELLAGRTWSQPFAPARTWIPEFDLNELKDKLFVHVAPVRLAVTPATRGSSWYDATCEIGFVGKPSKNLDAAVDAHVALVEEAVHYFRSQAGRSHRRVGDRALKFNITLVETPELILHAHLQEQKVCTSFIRLTGRTQR